MAAENAAQPVRSSEHPRGKLVVIAAPSGSGKTTIVRALMQRIGSLRFSVSGTTRSRRPEEVDGYDYYFLAREEFDRRVAAADFVEWENVYGDLYGTLRSEVDRVLVSGLHVVFDVDVKGALSIKRHYPVALLVFIQPPSLEALRQRLANRRTEDEDTIKRRMERAPMELELGKNFDHVVVNDDLEQTVEQVYTIVQQYLKT